MVLPELRPRRAPHTHRACLFRSGNFTMAIRIIVSNTVGFNVKGSINDAAGVPQPFTFKLICARLDADQIQARLNAGNDATLIDFLADVIEDWSGVRDADDKAIPYSTDALRQLCAIPGVAAVAFRAYIAEVGAKEKN